MSFYKHHIFFCLNHRDSGREHCSGKNAEAMQGYAKSRVKELGLAGPGGVRVNKAGCLDRCELGPVAVVSLMTAAAIGAVTPHTDAAPWLIALTLAALSGVMLLAMGLLIAYESVVTLVEQHHPEAAAQRRRR